MIENQIEHTFIVTADIATIKASRKNMLLTRDIQEELHAYGLMEEDAKDTKGRGGYFSRKIKI